MKNIYRYFISEMFGVRLGEDDIVKNRESGNIYTVKSHNPDTQALIKKDASEEDLQKVKDGEYKEEPSDKKTKGDESDKQTKKFKPQAVKLQKKKLSDSKKFIKNTDKNTETRYDILTKSWSNFLEANTYEEQVEAVRELAENNLIEGHAGGMKIYLSSNTSIPYKWLSGASGNSVTQAMNEIIKNEGIEVPLRGGAKDRALADMSGKHNEAGVVAYVFPSDENKKGYEETQQKLSELGGDEKKFDEINKKAANQLKSLLPSGAEITGAEQVGGVGKTALAKLGIDPKVDPTDLIVRYKDENGDEKIIKVSAKTYSDPKNITMKNSGTGNAGVTYLGDIGKELDDNIGELREKYAWDDTMSDEEKANQKRQLKQAYLSQFSDKMASLANTREGQQQLIKMWKDVHGCDQDVYTQIINKKTGEVEVKPPDYYCKPSPPFKVEFDGVKLVINMGGQEDQFLQIDMKTEDKGSPKLLFRHRRK